MKIILLLVFCVSFIVGRACINEYSIIPGVESNDEYHNELTAPTINIQELQRFREMKLKSCASLNTVECNDLVVAFLYLRDFKSALKYSEKMYAKFPKEYNIVITYAATLELNGRFEEALKYLNDAMEINPDSHEGSEWIHRKIIEDLLGRNTDDYSVIGFNSGTNIYPVSNYTKDELFEFSRHLDFQISERYFFIGKMDPSFGKLLFDYANVLYLLGGYELSIVKYEEAMKFGFKNEMIRKRLNYVKSNLDLLNQKDKEKDYETESRKIKNENVSDTVEKSNLIIYILIVGIITGTVILSFIVRRNKSKIR